MFHIEIVSLAACRKGVDHTVLIAIVHRSIAQ